MDADLAAQSASLPVLTSVSTLTSNEVSRVSKKNTSFLVSMIVAGIVEAVLPFITFFLILPQLYSLSDKLNIASFPPILTYGFFACMLVLSIIQVVFAGVLLRKKTVTSHAQKIALWLLIAGITFTISIIPIMLIEVLSPIYNALNGY